MSNMLEQGLYGPDTRSGVGWLAHSPGLSSRVRETLQRVATGTYPADARITPSPRMVVATDEGARGVFVMRSFIHAYEGAHGERRKAWFSHVVIGLSDRLRRSDLLALDGAPFWIGPREIEARSFSSVKLQFNEAQIYHHKYTTKALDLPPEVLEQALQHLADRPANRVCVVTDDLPQLSASILTLVRSADNKRLGFITAVSTLEAKPTETPFIVAGAPLRALDRLKSDRRYGILLNGTEFFVGEPSRTYHPRSGSEDRSVGIPPLETDRTEVPKARRDRPGGISELPINRPTVPTASAQLRQGGLLNITNSPVAPLVRASEPERRSTVRMVLADARAALTAGPKEPELIEAAIRAYLAVAPPDTVDSCISLLIEELEKHREPEDRRATSRLIGALLAQHPNSTAFADGSPATAGIYRLLQSVEFPDAAIAIRAGYGRLTDIPERAAGAFAREIAETFLNQAKAVATSNGALLTGAGGNGIRLALGVIGQSDLTDDVVKQSCTQLLDQILFAMGDVPYRVLVRTLPRELGQLAGNPAAIRDFIANYPVVSSIETQAKLETALMLLAGELGQGVDDTFGKLLAQVEPNDQKLPLIGAVASGDFKLETLRMIVPEEGRARMAHLYAERYGRQPVRRSRPAVEKEDPMFIPQPPENASSLTYGPQAADTTPADKVKTRTSKLWSTLTNYVKPRSSD